jgi:hypothetical protein
VVIGALSFPLGFSDNIAIVWLASVYANVVSDLGAGEAADDSAVLAKLEQLRVAGISRGRRMQPAMPPTMLPTRRRRAASPLTVG